MSLQKCANFSDCGPISVCMTDTRIQPEYPVLFSMLFSGEFCLRLKPYLIVKIAPDVLTENIAVKYAFWLWCFAAPTASCVLACAVSQVTPRNQRTTCFDLLTLQQANMGYEKYSLHVIFTFYLNRDTSVLELFPVVVFQWKRLSVLTAHAGLAIPQPCDRSLETSWCIGNKNCQILRGTHSKLRYM